LAYNTNATSPSANNVRYDLGVARQWSYRAQTFGEWPASFGTPQGTAAYQASVYVTYNTSGTPSDTIAPTVAITNPTDGATVGGTITLGATASDNVGVVSVRFQLNGADFGIADTTPPYATSWDTTLTAPGEHVLAAVARDGAGNVTTSTGVSVRISDTSDGMKSLGYPTVAATTDSHAADHISAWRFQMSNESGTATSLSIYVSGPLSPFPNNQFQAAIYADQDGLPSNLLASTSSRTLVPNAWNTVPLAATLQPNTSYWLAYNTNAASSAANNVRIDPGSPGQMRWRAQTFGSWPATFGPPTGSAAAQSSIFVIYKVP
jgi:hypothetical protein